MSIPGTIGDIPLVVRVKPDRDLWMNDEIKAQSRITQRAKHHYEKKELPERKTKWQTEQRKLTDMKRYARRDYNRGKLESITT